MTKAKAPVVVQPEPEIEVATLVVSSSYYDDTVKHTGTDPEALKDQFRKFEEEIKQPLRELAEIAGSILKPPSVVQRGPQTRPAQKEAE